MRVTWCYVILWYYVMMLVCVAKHGVQLSPLDITFIQFIYSIFSPSDWVFVSSKMKWNLLLNGTYYIHIINYIIWEAQKTDIPSTDQCRRYNWLSTSAGIKLFHLQIRERMRLFSVNYFWFGGKALNEQSKYLSFVWILKRLFQSILYQLE